MTNEDIVKQARRALPDPTMIANEKYLIPVFNPDSMQDQMFTCEPPENVPVYHMVLFEKKIKEGRVVGWSFVKIEE